MKRALLAMACIFITAHAAIGAEAASEASPTRPPLRWLDPPPAMFIHPTDGERLGGDMLAFGETGLIARIDDERRDFDWADFEAREVDRIYRKLLRYTEQPAAALVELAVVLRDLEGEESRLARGALRQAVRVDAGMREQALAVLRGERTRWHPPRADDDPSTRADATPEHGKEHGPRIAAHGNATYWGELSDEVMARSIESRKRFAELTQKKLDDRLALHETQYFLFYSDLPHREAKQWAGLLDKMYSRLADLFALPEGHNLFRGKGVIFVFQREADYHRFQQQMHGTPSQGSIGLCHGFGDGHVHIAFFRPEDNWRFAHVLVHESVHGFLHRYRSPVHIPSWVNEGLAEYIACQLVPQAGIRKGRLQHARASLQHKKSFEGMFQAPAIEAWQYGVALDLTEFMIANSKKRYADFVEGIKAGLPWEESLEERYGVPLERLIAAYAHAHDLRDLQP